MSSIEPSHDPAELLSHTGWMRSLARSLVSDSAAADDLVQETWLAFMKRPPRNPGAARAWLARVLRNFAFRRRRTEMHQLHRERLAARPEQIDSGPEEIVERAEMHHKVVELVLALKEPYRATVLYHFFGELSPPEIARKQGIPVTTVRCRIAKAVADLRVALDQAHRGDRRAWSLALLPLAAWTLKDVAAAHAAGSAAGAPWSGFSATLNFTLGGLSMTVKKTSIALLASLVLLIGLGSLLVVFRGQPREDGAAATPRTVVAAAMAAPSPAEPNSEAQASVAESPAPAPLPETAAAAPPSLVGAVTSTDAKPVEGARVVAVEAHVWSAPLAGVEEKYSGPHTGIPALQRTYSALAAQAASTRTAADGTYAFHGLHAGEYRVLVSHHDYLANPDSVTAVWEGETTRCDVTLAPGAPLRGRAVDETGRAVSGALITCEASRTAGVQGMAKAVRLLTAFSEGTPALDADTAKSGEDGSFSLQSLEPVPYDVKAAKDGFVMTRLRNAIPGKPAVTLVLRRGAFICGRALMPDGSPLSGVEVELRQAMTGSMKGGPGAMADFDLLGERSRRSSTGDDGRFRLEGVEAGTYDLTARVEGYPREKREVSVGKEPVDLGNLQFKPPASIVGIVLDAAGSPLEGARVWARLPDSPERGGREIEIEVVAEAASGAAGRFALTCLAPGRFDVLASANGGLLGAFKDVATAGQPAVIQLHRGVAIAGRCVDASGAPVEGASVRLERVEGSTVTAEDGAFELLGVPSEALSGGGLRLRATHPEYQSVLKRVDAEPEGKIELRFGVASGPRGIVLDQEGKPVPRARVHAELPGIPFGILAINPTHQSSVWSGRTDEAGTFRLSVALDPQWGGMPLEIEASHGGFGTGRASVPCGTNGEWPDVEIVLGPGSSLEGRITNSSGAAVAEARVEARLATSSELPPRFREMKDLLPQPKGIVAYTGQDGGYRLASLGAGSYQVEVSALDYARKVIEPVAISGATTRVDIALDAGSSISGRVLDDTGKPIADAELLAVLQQEAAPGEEDESAGRRREALAFGLGSGAANAASARSGADGGFELKRLPEGTIAILAQAPGFQPTFVQGATSEASFPDLVLLRDARLTGRALDGRSGLPTPLYQLRVECKEALNAGALPPAERVERTIASADGSFVWEDLAPGTYELKFSAPDHPPFRRRVVLQPGGEVFVEARLEAGARLDGVVKVRGIDAVVSKALVELRRAQPAGTPGESGRKGKSGGGVQSGKEGEFTFSGLEPGEYDLSVRHPDFYLDEEDDRIQLSLPRGEAAPLEIYLSPAGRLSGRLRARIPLDPKRDQFWFGLVRIADADSTRSGSEDRPKSTASLVAAGGPPVLADQLAYRERVEVDGSLKALGLRPGRYRLELHPVSLPQPGDLTPRGVAAGNDDAPPATTVEIEVRAGETTDLELELP